jgi:hypothetical protein
MTMALNQLFLPHLPEQGPPRAKIEEVMVTSYRLTCSCGWEQYISAKDAVGEWGWWCFECGAHWIVRADGIPIRETIQEQLEIAGKLLN